MKLSKADSQNKVVACSKRNDHKSIHGRKMGRPRKYATVDEARAASQVQQRDYKRRVRVKGKRVKLEKVQEDAKRNNRKK